MRKKCTAAFLSFVTEGNKGIRKNLFDECFPEFEKIKEINTDLDVQLVAIDNDSIGAVKESIIRSSKIDIKYVLTKNMFDVALFYAGLEASKDFGSDYILFTYDDFFIYDHSSLQDIVEFMDERQLDCIRVTEYSVDNSAKFDTRFTSKSENPDAIRHTNTATGKPVQHFLEMTKKERRFYRSNWHYTSRPCVWRSSTLRSILDSVENVKILQGFESFMVEECQKRGVKFATFDVGMMRTYPVSLSARTSPDFVKKVDEIRHTVNVIDMKEEINKARISR